MVECPSHSWCFTHRWIYMRGRWRGDKLWFHSEAAQETLHHNTVKQSEQTDCQVKPLPWSGMWWKRSSKGCVMRECVLYVNKLDCSCFIWYIPNDFHVFTDNESTFSLIPELVTVCSLAVCSQCHCYTHVKFIHSLKISSSDCCWDRQTFICYLASCR